MGTIFASFHISGMEFVLRARLYSLVRKVSASGPRCLRWWMEIRSGPVDLLFLLELMACQTCALEMTMGVDGR